MSRKAGEPMRKLLALHNEWLVANGYPLHATREKKKQNSTIQSTSDPPQPTSEITKKKNTSEAQAA